MSETEAQKLETAYRTANVILKGCLQTWEIPKFLDPQTLSSLKLKNKIEECSSEIQFLQDVKDGKLKPIINVVEGDGIIHSLDIKENQEALKCGIEILKKWRRAYARRLTWLKLQQPMIKVSVSKAQELTKQAQVLITELDNLDNLMKRKLDNLMKLRVEYNNLHQKYDQVNLDQNLNFPEFPSLPRHIAALKTVYQLSW